MGCKLCTHQCECGSTKNSSLTEEQVSRNLRIESPLPKDALCQVELNFAQWFLRGF